MKKLVLGLDCGGTKTAAALACLPETSSGGINFRPLGFGYSGPSNPYSLGYDQTFANITRAIQNAFEQSQTPFQTVESIAICMAGAGRDEESERVRAWAASQKLADRIHVGDDITLIRWAARWEIDAGMETNPERLERWDSIVTLIAGTGSIACCTDRQEHTERVGGWGYLLGDEGSGFSIGLNGLKSIFAAYDRKLPSSEMQQELLDAMHCRTVPELIPAVYRSPLPRSEIAALAPIILRYARRDSQARDIAEQAVEALSRLVWLALDRAQARNLPYLLAVSGGLLDPASPILQGLQDRLATYHCVPTRTHIVQHPVHGALCLAAMQRKQSGA